MSANYVGASGTAPQPESRKRGLLEAALNHSVLGTFRSPALRCRTDSSESSRRWSEAEQVAAVIVATDSLRDFSEPRMGRDIATCSQDAELSGKEKVR